MKDFKLPEMNKEERQIIWDNLKAGDKLIKFGVGGWDNDWYYSVRTVSKKTSAGSIRLDDGELLKVFFPSYYLIIEEINECVKQIKLQNEVMQLLFNIDRDKKKFKSKLTYEDASALKDLLTKIMSDWL